MRLFFVDNDTTRGQFTVQSYVLPDGGLRGLLKELVVMLSFYLNVIKAINDAPSALQQFCYLSAVQAYVHEHGHREDPLKAGDSNK